MREVGTCSATATAKGKEETGREGHVEEGCGQGRRSRRRTGKLWIPRTVLRSRRDKEDASEPEGEEWDPDTCSSSSRRSGPQLESEEDGAVGGVWIVGNVMQVDERKETTGSPGADPNTAQKENYVMDGVHFVARFMRNSVKSMDIEKTSYVVDGEQGGERSRRGPENVETTVDSGSATDGIKRQPDLH